MVRPPPPTCGLRRVKRGARGVTVIRAVTRSADNRSDLPGPLDKEYVFNDNVGVTDLVWSKCGVARDLNVATRVMVRNNPRKTGTGYISNSSVDGSIELKFKLSWRSC